MMSEQLTHEALVKPIPLPSNLANAQDQRPSKTCRYCSMIVPDRSKVSNGLIQTGYDRVDIYPEFPELKASSKAGCGFCRLLRKTIRTSWAVRPMEEWGVGPVRREEGPRNELLDAPWDGKVRIHKVTFNVENSRVDWRSGTHSALPEPLKNGMVVALGLEFGPATRFVSPDTDVEYGEIGQAISFKIYDSQDLEVENEARRRRLPSISTLSASNLDMISTWIDDCKSHHPACRLSEAPWLPTRLLDVGPLDGSQIPRLVETSPADIHDCYAALSHMWGDPTLGQLPPVRTLQANYTSILSGIPRQMSRNFVDAVIATRQLGLRYIWIDSLCIIQDSPEDWRLEAATMRMYDICIQRMPPILTELKYSTSATSANDGFLSRYLDTIPATKIAYTLSTGTDSAKNMIISPQDSSETGTWTSDIEGSSWNKRGWTLQERSVSTRTLHFCKTKLYFECRQVLRSEENEPLDRFAPRTFKMWPRAANGISSPKAPEVETRQIEDLYNRWTRAVSEYSQRRLTKETDKLVAIQALANEMATSVDDTYVSYAGMWKKQLQRELLWRVIGRPRSMEVRYLAPSWSWVSMNATISFQVYNPGQKLSNSSLGSCSFLVIEVSEPLKTESVRNYVKVEAFLKPLAFILECDNDDRWVNGSQGSFPYNLFIRDLSLTAEVVDISISKPSMAQRHAAVKDGHFSKFAEGCLDLDDKDDLTKSNRLLFYLHVAHSRPSGLILEQTTSADGEVLWKRIGVATVFTQDFDLFDPCFSKSEEPVEVTII